MCAATAWKWTTSLLDLFIYFSMVNLRLFTTRIWINFKLFRLKTDGIKIISGTASLWDKDPQGHLWKSGSKYWKLAQSELVIGLFSFQTRLIVLVY
jgi:hypothetical protein